MFPPLPYFDFKFSCLAGSCQLEGQRGAMKRLKSSFQLE